MKLFGRVSAKRRNRVYERASHVYPTCNIKGLSGPGDSTFKNTIPAEKTAIKIGKRSLLPWIRSCHRTSRISIAARTPNSKASARHGIRTKARTQLSGQKK